MIFRVTERVEMWEMVAAIQLAAAFDAWLVLREPEYRELAEASGVKLSGDPQDEWEDSVTDLRFAAAYRAVDRGREPYLTTLAVESGLGVIRTIPPIFQSRQGSENGAIVVATKGLKADLDLPEAIWLAVIKYLRSYDCPVFLVGDEGTRVAGGAFTEAEILCDVPLGMKLDALAQARLVIGVPNAWTMIAASWIKRILILYPDGIPVDRWYWIDSSRFGKIVHDPRRISIPAVLSGVRQMIARYDD